ncbi:putative disease resistance protein RGA1 [Chenopodium quinoa]|uniref:putative disease resistance protein RGA1 n=1 Tax=Chenopodium quinoa TaxID=63459 RepID=UPI000B77CF47|nr:putative disease resistance protein RGA1 [Chenopodium quinoa]
MDIVGTALSAAQTLFAALQCSQLKEILSCSKSKLGVDDLQHSIEAITAVLRDAETKQELSHQEKLQIEELKNAVFEADDLLDEFATLVQQKQLLEADGRVSEKLRRFFSGSNPLVVAYRMSQGVKESKMKLDAIASNTRFYFKHDPEPIRKRRLETCSYVDAAEIIGREDDLEKIVSMLLASDVQGDVTFLSIVGIGGLGKTTLAQLVFNDPRVITAFPLRLWTCVSDEVQKQLDIAGILQKILALATGQKHEGSTMDQVQSQLREQLASQRYLLVLDDVWTENRDQWCELVKYLIGGQRGSWIVVTTRSQKTATIIGGGQMYELQGLSKENSWHLFERTAFGPDKYNHNLVEIGLEIVDKCAQVPLAIKIVGSLLYGQDKSKWQSVQEIGLANIRESENGIIPILKLSFHHLESPLKSCFSYCALFPKDFLFFKDDLISLWMAQGYIVPLDEGQSIEDAGEEYFSILLRRCFFQDVNRDKFGEIISCKIHDLMHDIAQSVSGKEVYTTDTISSNLDKKVRHLSVACVGGYGKYSWGKTHIRSLFAGSYFKEVHPFPVKVLEEILASCRYLRALELCGSNIERLPDSIGKLLHLRYLDLSNSKLVKLPKSITKVYNLQTLILTGCKNLKELPKDLRRLVKLRFLDIQECDKLEYMPGGMSKLTCLKELSDFVVGGKGSCLSWEQWFYGLEDLKALRNLKDSLRICIRWPENAVEIVKDDSRREGLYLSYLKHLDAIEFVFTFDEDYEEEDDYVEEEDSRDDSEADRKMDKEAILNLMEDLQPHSNLKMLDVWGYHGEILPGWVSLLTNLVLLHLEYCEELKFLPCLRNLPHLKSLSLDDMASLEYIEKESLLCVDSTLSRLGSNSEEQVSFFPSLEKLRLSNLPKLKGWRRGVEDSSSNSQLIPCLSALKTFKIRGCPELTCVPLGPSSTTTSNHIVFPVPKLRKVGTDNVRWLNLLPMEVLQCLERLKIDGDNEVVNLPDRMQFLTNLKILEIFNCGQIKAMPNWLPKLTSLRKLDVFQCSESLDRRFQIDPPGEDWPYVQHIPFICVGSTL